MLKTVLYIGAIGLSLTTGSVQPAPAPAAEQWSEMKGLYVYYADAGLFTDCADGKRRPVAAEGDNAALERAYGMAEHDDREPLLARLEGHYETRAALDGSGTEEVLIVDMFQGLTKQSECPEGSDLAGLTNVDWRLTSLPAATISDDAVLSRAGIMLHSGGRVSGSNGCNRLMGQYRAEAEQLTFGQLVTTRMACPGALMTLESAFDTMLSQVDGWRIEDGRLVLLGNGEILATFESADERD